MSSQALTVLTQLFDQSDSSDDLYNPQDDPDLQTSLRLLHNPAKVTFVVKHVYV